jgi:phytase-like protein
MFSYGCPPFPVVLPPKKLMRKYCLFFSLLIETFHSAGQVSTKKFTNRFSPAIITTQGVHIREGGFSGLVYIPGSNMEFFTNSDRGFAIDAGKTKYAKGKEKVLPVPGYCPKIHRIKLEGDSIHVMNTMTVKRPDGSDACGLPLPVGAGNTGETLWGDIPADKMNIHVLGTDQWGIDPEGVCLGADNTFWLCEEFGTSIWHVDANGRVIMRYSPYGNGDHQVGIDTVLRYRRPNKGFEGIAITPCGKVYGFVQSTMEFPSTETMDTTRVMRVLEIDPATNKTRMFAYVNDGAMSNGDDKVKPKDWEIGDAAAVNDSEILVIEHKVKKSAGHMIIYRVNIAQATPITNDWVKGKAIEQYYDRAGLATIGIKPVEKTEFLELNAKNGWDPKLVKTEDLAIVNDSTIVVGIDNDYGIESTKDGVVSTSGQDPVMYVFSLKGRNKIARYVPPANAMIKTGSN